MSRFPHSARCLLAILTLGAAASCGGSGSSAPPVATVTVSLGKTSVALGGVLDLTYRFQVAADAKINGDYLVFVHLNREDGTTIWNDDHELPEGLRTSQWKPGQVVEYTRTRFMPTFAYVGIGHDRRGTLSRRRAAAAGRARPGGSPIPRRGRTGWRRSNCCLRSEKIQVFRLSGWHAPEFAADDPTVEWQWTQKVATLSFRNPRRDVTLFLEYDTRSDLVGGEPQQIGVFCGDDPGGGLRSRVVRPHARADPGRGRPVGHRRNGRVPDRGRPHVRPREAAQRGRRSTGTRHPRLSRTRGVGVAGGPKSSAGFSPPIGSGGRKPAGDVRP